MHVVLQLAVGLGVQACGWEGRVYMCGHRIRGVSANTVPV